MIWEVNMYDLTKDQTTEWGAFSVFLTKGVMSKYHTEKAGMW